MKKYVVFAVSFIVLFVVFQVVMGIVMAYMYTPDITGAWQEYRNIPSEVIIKGQGVVTPLLIAFIAATLAYFTPKWFVKEV